MATHHPTSEYASMTENINTYTFDYKDETETLQQEPLKGVDRILFTEVHVAATDGRKDPQIDVLQKIGKQRISDRRLAENLKEHFRTSAFSAMQTLPHLFRKNDYLMMFNDKGFFAKYLGVENKNKQVLSLFSFYHEAGHALVPNGHVSAPIMSDAAADGYAALRLIQRFGQEAIPLLSLISWLRAFSGEPTHLTTTVLDEIIADSATQNFSGLGPQETIDRAAAYAEELMPRPEMIPAYQKLLDRTKFPTKRDMLNAALSSGDDFSFYIAAKALQPYLHHGGLITDGKLAQLTDDEIAKYNAVIDERAGKTSLSEIFASKKKNASPAPTFRETLPVSLPASQNKVVFNLK
jgi:hypothetical protein